MSRGSRWLLILLLGGFCLLAVGAVAAAAVVYHAGTVQVDLRESGTDLHVALPAALVDLALAVAPTAALRSATREAEPYLPAIVAAWEELERVPDFVLLEVRSGADLVLVEKRAGRLVVRVDEDGASRLRVGLPLHTVRRWVARLAA